MIANGRTALTVHKRSLLLILTVLVVVAALVGVTEIGEDEPSPDRPSRPPTSHDEPDAVTGAHRSPWRPQLHLTPDAGWMNDVQRPFYADGRWRLFNLVNHDYPDGNGTSWQGAESSDLVHWKPAGIAIEKYRNGLGDIETGSVVVDTHDTAGFGRGAIVALATQQLDGVQRQSLFYSHNAGRTFRSYSGNPVLDNPGSPDFRDPKVVWDHQRHQWVMVLAEGHRLGFYRSPDLKHWTYASDFARDDLGTLECPDLFPMSVDGDPSRSTWILGTSANGSSTGGTTGYAYWTGHWDGSRFTPDRTEPAWLDHGSDFYAGVTWSDPRASRDQQLAERYAIGWMNNWSYARDVPALPSTGGSNTLVRRIRLRTVDGRPSLVSTPVGLGAVTGRSADGRTGSMSGTTPILRTDRNAYRLHVRLRPPAAGESRIVVRAADGSQMTVGYDARSQRAFVVRDEDAIAARMPDTYRQVRTARVPPLDDGSVDLDILTDGSATEVYVDHGRVSLSNLVFLGQGTRTVSVESVGGPTTVESATLAPLNP